MIDKKELGSFLHYMRKELRMTLKLVANVMDCDEKTIRNIEHGKSTPELDTLCNLCAVYGIPPERIAEFFEIDDELHHALEIYHIKDYWKSAEKRAASETEYERV